MRDQCQTYFFAEKSKVRRVNYEDLFFAASQLYEHLSQEYENPAMEPFARCVLESLPMVFDREDLKELAGSACDYISDVVAIRLRADPNGETHEHLTCLVDAVTDDRFGGCDIFTLNHDLLIESVLAHKGITLVDGFGDPDGDVSWWRSEMFNFEA